jgi:WD40 repeat protein
MPAGLELLVSVNDGAHYLLASAAPAAPPLAVFKGHATRGFFVKAVFSPDGSHLLSGSADNCAYIWQVGPSGLLCVTKDVHCHGPSRASCY